jgi:lipopolysaccharide export system ATP-binding protein
MSSGDEPGALRRAKPRRGRGRGEPAERASNAANAAAQRPPGPDAAARSGAPAPAPAAAAAPPPLAHAVHAAGEPQQRGATSAPPRRSADRADDAQEALKLSTIGLRKVYRGRAVVQDVSIEIGPGEIVGLLGPNGAGKTTTFYMVVGLTQPDAGQVFLGEDEITDLPMYLRAQRGISYLPQEPSIFRRLSVEDNLRAIFETLDLAHGEQERRIDQLIQDFGLGKVRRNKGYSLSGGERRRVEIARALVISPWYILLDEPFAGIDPIAVLEIQGIVRHLKAMGIGILITDHNVRETLKITDRAYIINNGEILRSGTPPELSTDPQVRKIYLGEGFSL